MATIQFTGNIVQEVRNENGYLNFTVSEKTDSFKDSEYSYYECGMRIDKFPEKLIPHIVNGAIVQVVGKHYSTTREHEGKKYTNWHVIVLDIELKGSVRKEEDK
ncbi:hypothetical protein M2451_003900 [Dysgonomonas sp. PFB1-18]|uniref:hypothetical protein n=1 Tax=unclassified Dysgonomonas TaxID=2630389 RepID=UPI00247653E6|nr:MULTISPECIES: hypothetical protein [unclassified Dysgonomonas]MDH6311056.1 hypothetical protein [Dysgonomonas sp. PF1-14]MDH6341106.1 hypothetical protein [Dysgonomonas sp. PF1-16]MDH6382559.1 hypothetical protein [Dysgonomonas sp. PFB1-18]MDH6399907.1 hypothetical protein [Dysgonomonas sp. PF1-23]